MDTKPPPARQNQLELRLLFPVPETSSHVGALLLAVGGRLLICIVIWVHDFPVPLTHSHPCPGPGPCSWLFGTSPWQHSWTLIGFISLVMIHG